MGLLEERAGGGDMRGVQVEACFTHAVGVCEDEEEAGGSADGAAGGAGGGDIRGVQVASCFTHAVGVCDYGDESGGGTDGAVGGADGGDIRGDQLTGRFTDPSIDMSCHCTHYPAPVT